MSKCLMCFNDSHWHKYCEKCISMRANACSIINYNSKQLKKLFSKKWYTPEWFEKFTRYINNINNNMLILMKFLEKDNHRRFKILK